MGLFITGLKLECIKLCASIMETMVQEAIITRL